MMNFDKLNQQPAILCGYAWLPEIPPQTILRIGQRMLEWGHSFIRENSWTVWWLNSKANKDFKHEICIGRHQMTRLQKNRVKKTVQTVKRRLIFILSLLGLSAAALIFRVGETWWPPWMVASRTRLIAVLLFAFLMVVASFRLMIESSKRPRTYPGIGKNPYFGP